MKGRGVPLFVALHHPVYSADDHHSGSIKMKAVIDEASKTAGRCPAQPGVFGLRLSDNQSMDPMRAVG